MWGAYATIFVLMPVTAHALGALAQSFTTTDSTLVAGTMVDLKPGTSSAVEKAVAGQSNQLIGVVADAPLITLGSGAQQAQVVVIGITPVFVSNINGNVEAGDKIAASPIQGVGMNAMNSGDVIGTAEGNLADTQTTTKQIIDKSGKTNSIKIGTVEVLVNVSYYTAPQSNLDAFIPTFLVNVGSFIAGKSVSPSRVLVGFLSLLVGFLVAGIMLNAGVRSGMISLGRNPMARDVLRRSLVDVLITSMGLLLISAILFYLILTF